MTDRQFDIEMLRQDLIARIETVVAFLYPDKEIEIDGNCIRVGSKGKSLKVWLKEHAGKQRGDFVDYGTDASGDVYALIAYARTLRMKEDFPEVLDVGRESLGQKRHGTNGAAPPGRPMLATVQGVRVEDQGDQAPPSTPKRETRDQVAGSWVYRDPDDQVQYTVTRWNCYDAKTGEYIRKRFTQAGPDGVASIQGIERIPYNLPAWYGKSDRVVIVEGEKKAHMLIDLGWSNVTTISGGAGAWPKSSEDWQIEKWFEGLDVAIIIDNDKPGRDAGQAAAAILDGVAASVRVVDLPDLAEGDGLDDWFMASANNDLDRLRDIIAGTPPWSPEDGPGEAEQPDQVSAVARFDWRVLDGPVQPILSSNWLIHDLIPAEGLGVIYGQSNTGKSALALDLALHIAHGIDWRGRRTRQTGVVYLAAEAGRLGFNRVAGWQRQYKNDAPAPMRLSPALIDLFSTDDDTDALLQDTATWCDEDGHQVGLVIVDTLARAMAGGNENASEDMTSLIGHCERIALELDAHVLLVHHSGKDETRGARGHSSLRAAVNVELEVLRDQQQPGLIQVTKQREGQTGIEIGFDLKAVDLGVNPDTLDKVRTIVAIEHAVPDRKPSQDSRKRKRLGRNQRVLYQALLAALGDHGEPSPGYTGMPDNVRVVTRDRWRDAALPRLTFDDDDDPRHKHKRFKRAEDSLLDQGIIESQGAYVWVIDNSTH